jgi:hypothetical protein
MKINKGILGGLSFAVLLGIVAFGLGSRLTTSRRPSMALPPGVDSIPTIVMYKSRYCGCCAQWVKYLEEKGIVVDVHNVEDPRVHSEEFGVPKNLRSCHVSKFGNYVLEGHVPVDDLLRLLTDHPDVRGLAVPGMPEGAQGMKGTGGYQVVSFTASGDTAVYATH